MDRVCRDCGRPFWSDDVDEFDTSGLCPACKKLIEACLEDITEHNKARADKEYNPIKNMKLIVKPII